VTRAQPGVAPAPADLWTVEIHRAGDDGVPLGAGVVIDRRRVLTCAHVVAGRSLSERPLDVTFPKAGAAGVLRRLVVRVRVAADPHITDVAILELAESVPPAVRPAMLRSPPPEELIGERWWAFGFPQDARLGSEAYGVVGGVLSYGWVQLDTDSKYGIKPGFSGTGLWSPQFGAVVGIVGQVQRGGEHRGDAQALTLHQIRRALPEEGLDRLTTWTVEAAGEAAHAAWGWSLAKDPEAGRHWRPRARGVSTDSERGFRFRGRRAALARIVDWLHRSKPDRRVLVVTGSPGVGKSAVLGRVVTTADAEIRAALPADDDYVKSDIGSIACAVHVKGKTAADVAAEIARAASVSPTRDVEDLPKALRRALEQRRGQAFNLVIDALDEATSAAQARQIVSRLILPIAETCAIAGARVVVGTRRVDDGGELLATLGAAAQVLDLDAPEYFAEDDLAAYVLATLALVGDERQDNPYTDQSVAAPLARGIAKLADRNFLIAGLVARTHGMYDESPVHPDDLDFTATVDAALATYLERLPPVAGVPATLVLTGLAYAQPPGFSVRLWRTALAALDVRVGNNDLIRFIESSAANFLIESVSDGDVRRFRLFHQALNDALVHERERHDLRIADERAIARGMVLHGRRTGWRDADRYLLRSLPLHASRTDVIDLLLADDDYLLHADLARLTPLAGHARTPVGQARARLLQLTPQAIAAPVEQRVALFSVTETLEQLGQDFAPGRPAPYRARWASVNRRIERVILEGHAGAVNAVCALEAAGTTRIATAGSDGTVRLWDLTTGRHQATLARHSGPVVAVCPVQVGSQIWLASAGRDGTVRLWDPVTGHHERLLAHFSTPITGMAGVFTAGRTVLAIGCQDGVVQVCEPATGRQTTLRAHRAAVTAVGAFTLDSLSVLITAGKDRAVRVWDLATMQEIRSFVTSIEDANAVCCAMVGGQALAVAATFRTVWLWDIETRATLRIDKHSERIWTVCPVDMDGETWFASAGDDRVIFLWSPEDGEVRRALTGHPASVKAVSTVEVEGRPLLISAGQDGTARVWDPKPNRDRTSGDKYDRVNSLCATDVDGQVLVGSAAVSRQVGVWDVVEGRRLRPFAGHIGGAFAICAVRLPDGNTQFATAGNDDSVRLWDPFTGAGRVLLRRAQGVSAMCTATIYGRDLLVMAGFDGSPVQMWDPQSGKRVRFGPFRRSAKGIDHQDHATDIRAVCTMTLGRAVLCATAGGDRTIRLWDLSTGRLVRILVGHDGPVTAVCPADIDGQPLLASGGRDRTVRLWDPFTGILQTTLTGHLDAVSGICTVTLDGQTCLASTSHDRTVRVWDPMTCTTVRMIPLHHPAFACVSTPGLLVVGLSAGVLALKLDP
jgi:WD40 repeat protein